MSTFTSPSQPKKTISLSLKISEEDRNRLLTQSAEPLRPFFRKLFAQSESIGQVKPEAEIPEPLNISRDIRLLGVVRHNWESPDDLDSNEEEEWECRHKRWLGSLANALMVVMTHHSNSLHDSQDSGDSSGTDSEDEGEQWREMGEKIHERLTTQTKRSYPWIDYLGYDAQKRTFTGSDFHKPGDLAAVAYALAKVMRNGKEREEKQRKRVKSLMGTLGDIIEMCETMEAWLLTSLELFLAGAQILRLAENPTRHIRQLVVQFLRNYVATVLLVESVINGDRKAKTEDVGNNTV